MDANDIRKWTKKRRPAKPLKTQGWTKEKCGAHPVGAAAALTCIEEKGHDGDHASFGTTWPR